jgi:CRISPR system Cascade subunit CasD
MQSWGVESKFDRRLSGRAPSKSGVVGLCAAALGIRRDEPERLAPLCALRFGVRTDKPGVLLRDFHTAHSEIAAYVTQRFYLSDAAFLAGLEGDEELLCQVDAAIRAPAFPLFLGRRGCPPEGRVALAIVDKPLANALRDWDQPLNAYTPKGHGHQPLPRLTLDAEAEDADAFFQRDLPASFDPRHRRYDFRRVREVSLKGRGEEAPPMEIDYFAEAEREDEV